jgi:uncharacterized protein DUF4956
MAESRSRWATRFGEHQVLTVFAYYFVLFGAAFAIWRASPQGGMPWTVGSIDQITGTAGQLLDSADTRGAARAEVAAAIAGRSPAVDVAIAMSTAALLMLPVAWLYIMTRKKKGYTQSVVQTLVLLPVVVAGVVVLVKESLALAFSLAGIVAAVRFRNTLEDSKDAVYIFLATGIGIAAGVQVSVAVVISILFNLIILFLWYTDFGRSPVALEGARAERQLQRALSAVNRTGAFIARLDDEILKSMSPDQLDALANRAWRRKKRNAPDLIITGETAAVSYENLLRVRTAEVEEARRAVEFLLNECVQRWRFGGVTHEPDGTHFVEYGVELKTGIKPKDLLNALDVRGAPYVLGAQLK